MYEKKFYSDIRLPIEINNTEKSVKYSEEQENILKNSIIIILLPFKNLILRTIGINKIINKEWLNQKHLSKLSSLYMSPHPLLEVNHLHTILIFGIWEIKIDHFLYIALRKMYILGDKSVYPECLKKHFFLKALYELSSLKLVDIFTRQGIKDLNNRYFESTNSLESLLEGRYLIGSISSENYNFLKDKVLNSN